jgi:3'-5' exoribonuclease
VNQPDSPPSETPPSADETVRKVYVRDLREKQPVFTVFRVTRKGRHTARNGKSFLVLGFGDKTGEVDGRVFEGIDAVENAFRVDDYVLVKGHVVSFHGKPQVIAESLERLDPEPIDATEFALPTPPEPSPPPPPRAGTAGPELRSADGARAVAQVRELVERVEDAHVKALLLSILDDPEVARGLPVAPAAKGVHHSYRGGLAEHLLSVMRLAHRVADHYPVLDRDLLVAGALLHDIGKVSELSYAGGGVGYTDEGLLVGSVVMTAQTIHHKAAQLPDFPQALEHHLTHLVLAHHGQLELGSPKLPMTLEALALQAIDSLDARLASWVELMARETGGAWVEPTRLTERPLWRGPSPTGKTGGPAESRRRRKRPGAPHATERKERDTTSVPRLTLPPLEALTGSPPTTDVSEEPTHG